MKKGDAQRQIYANCTTLEEVIEASRLSEIRKQFPRFSSSRDAARTTPERIRMLFESGVDFNWSKKEEGFRR